MKKETDWQDVPEAGEPALEDDALSFARPMGLDVRRQFAHRGRDGVWRNGPQGISDEAPDTDIPAKREMYRQGESRLEQLQGETAVLRAIGAYEILDEAEAERAACASRQMLLGSEIASQERQMQGDLVNSHVLAGTSTALGGPRGPGKHLN